MSNTVLVYLTSCEGDFSFDRVTVWVVVPQDDVVVGGGGYRYVEKDLVLQLRKSGVASPRVVGEDGIVVADPDGRVFVSPVAVLHLVLELMERGQVVEPLDLVALQADHTTTTLALAAICIIAEIFYYF